jgi:CLIP-associating protein 1/2
MKAMFDEARERVGRLSPEAKNSMRRALADGDTEMLQGGPVKQVTAQLEEVQIYEDPFVEDSAQAGAQDERKVLGELPVNENVRVESPTQSLESGASASNSPINNSTARVTSNPQDRRELMRDRHLLASAIERIRTKNLDAHGFRRVQDIARSKQDIWESGKKFDELMGVLLEYLRTFDSDPKLAQLPASKSSGLKTQALGLVRALLTIYRKSALPWYAKALVTVIACRKGVDANSHILADMQRTTDEIVAEAAPETCVDSVLDALPSLSEAPSATAMALSVLRQLLISAKQRDVDIGSERRTSVATATAKFLGDADSEVRKADVELASELFEAYGESKAEFWSEFKGVEEGRLGLLTYYIAKKGRTGSVGAA